MEGKDIRATRRHRILDDRGEQIDYNLKAIFGGKPYIDARLSRHACETSVSWEGSKASQNAPSGVQGRKNRAFYINYAGRIASKLNQFTTGPKVKRDGASADHIANTTATGVDIYDFFSRVGTYVTGAGWCWLHVDRTAPQTDPETGKAIPRSIAQAEASGDRIWWGVWSPTSVVDWRFSESGGLSWLITESCEYVNESPSSEAEERLIRTIWVPGGGVRLYLDRKKPGEVVKEEEFTISAPIIPFVPVGYPSCDPHWFDSVEHVAASILNLDSCNHENLLQAVYPQMVIPASVLSAVKDQSGALGHQDAMTFVRGLNFPIMEDPQDSGITRFITPPKSELQALPEECARRRREMFDTVGMGLQKESRQVESAESKAFDRLDVNAVLAQRARLLQEAERKAIAISKALDPSFAVYDPVYPTEFDVSDLSTELEALLGLDSLSLPDGAKREVKKAGIGVLAKIGNIPAERVEELRREADEADLSAGLNAFASNPFPPRQG